MHLVSLISYLELLYQFFTKYDVPICSFCVGGIENTRRVLMFIFNLVHWINNVSIISSPNIALSQASSGPHLISN